MNYGMSYFYEIRPKQKKKHEIKFSDGCLLYLSIKR